MNKTKIEWVKNPDGTQGYTWNPITGCLNGCDYCYARRLANTRLKERYLANPKVADIEGQLRDSQSPLWDRVVKDPFYPRFWEDRLLGLRTRKPRQQSLTKPKGVFVCDMSDLFGIGIPEGWTGRVLETIKACPQHRFYLLTKQPQNLIKWSPFPDNCFIGVTATDYWKYVDACNYLARIEAKVKYISFEPLLSWDKKASYFFNSGGINWVIIGAQTKPYKPPKIEWVQEIVQACDKAGIPVFLKNNLYQALPSMNRLFFDVDGVGEIRQELPQ